MDLKKVMEKLAAFPEQSISFYGVDGRVVRKPYTEVRVDILGAMERLRGWGVEPGMRVGVLATNCYEFILYDMALLELKCTSLAFPEEFGNKTSQQLIEDYRLNILLLSEKDVWPRLAAGEWTGYMDAESPASRRAREVVPSVSNGEYTPAITFSSGSSGKIKGMIINPHGAEDDISQFYRLFDIDSGDGLLIFLPLSSFQQRLMVYAGFYYGFDLYLVKPAQLFAAFKDFSPTLCLAPPLLYENIHNQFMKAVNGMSPTHRRVVGALTTLARIAPSEGLRKRLRQVCYGRIYSSLGGRIRVMWTGMAPIRRSTLDFFADAHIPLYEAYGTSESGIIASNSPSHNRTGSVGRPVEGNVCLAEDGEIIVRRKNITTKGYVYYDDTSDEQTYLDANTVATGDIGRFDKDGYLYLLGRKKEHIVTAQGYKVHPELLEGKINVCAGVERSVIFGNELPYLFALVSIQQGADAHARQRIERHITQINLQLPPIGRIQKFHLTTEQFTVENGLLTRNLKLNRRGLFRRFEAELLGDDRAAGPNGGQTYDAPRTETERVLAEIWQDVLKTKRVGRADKFLDLGGDSLLAAQVLSRIRDSFQIDFPIATLFETGELAGLARNIDDFARMHSGSAVPRIERAARDGELPLSYAQQRLWFLQQLEPGSHSYNEINAVRLTGALDAAALGWCLSTIVERHEVLRTSFEATDGRPSQIVHAPEVFTLPLLDLSSGGEGDRAAEVQRHAEELVHEPFELTRRSLMRALLLRFGATEHVLLLVMHHIVSDGWSMAVLLQEAAALYDAYSGGQQSSLPELPIQYADYAVWQREWLRGDVLQSQLEFWKRRLAGAPPLLELPTDRPRPALQTTRGAHEPVHLTSDLTIRLEALGQREGASLFMTLLAALVALLSRYTSQEDICVGAPVANRPRRELERLIGFFVNTLVLRVDSAGDLTFLQLLARVKATALEAFDHQDVPFEKLIEELPVERRLSHSPLFQVMFVLQNAMREELKLPGLKLDLVDIETGTAKFDLLLNLTRTAEGLSGSLEYNTDLFDAETAKRMTEHFSVLLEDVAADPGRRISRLAMLTEEERRRMLVEWNDTSADYPRAACVHELFASEAARTPEAVAILHGGERMTYGDLDHRADLLACYLRQRGVGPESRVGICVGRSPLMIVAVLGALRAGAAYVPLDPTYPPGRLSLMLEDSGAKVLLTQEEFADVLPVAPIERVLLDADWESISREAEVDAPTTGVLPENVSYVLYTSGSTGTPKGVAMCHRALTNLVSWQLRHSNLPAGGRTLQFASLNFDVSFQEIFATLCGGGTLVLVDETTRRDPLALLRHLSDERVERLFLPFVALQQLAEAARGAPHPLLVLREVITAGEQLHVTPAVSELFARMESCTLHNQYGPTESHVVTAQTLEGDVAGWESFPPIGVPIANAQIYLLDRHLQPVPVGVTGELYIGGDVLARGYLGRPVLTAERFVPSPFGPEAGARLYRTGDSARYLKDGRIEYLGRLDFQVKVRGFRVEPEEVEAALARHQGVQACAVAAHNDAAAWKRLVAYIVARESATLNAGELREFLRSSVPEYMVPSVFIFLDALPLTPSGKVNRRALPEPDQLRPEPTAVYVAPRTPDEETLARIWAELLGVERVGVHDSFFDLGGHSLLATQAISRINAAFEMEVPLARIFEADTVAKLAEVIHEQKAARQAEAERIAQLLAQVKALSPEELRAMLQEKV
jgi:amino acid adenylation domain-containing protein